MVIRYNNDPSDQKRGFAQEVLETAETRRIADLPWTSIPYQAPSNIPSITQRAIDIYLLSQRPNGSVGGIGWWQCANGYTAMALHDLWSGITSTDNVRRSNYTTLDQAIRKCESRQPGLINVFNDDTLWWGLLCLHIYSLQHDTWYLSLSRGIWKHIRQSGSVCGRGQVLFRGKDMEGAVYWTTKPDEEQLNSISTALFAELSVRLALVARTQQDFLRCPYSPADRGTSFQEYVEAARCSLGWVLRCRYRPEQGVVLDHIKLKRDKCVDWTFTYNTGVTLGACALLYSATGEEEYMHLACHMATKAMTHHGWVEADGVLTEKGAYGRGTHDPWKDDDSVGFKAVLVRQLGVLYDIVRQSEGGMPRARETAELIRSFVNVNFRSQIERNGNRNGQYGPWWDGPFECPTSHAQMAVLDVMAAVRLVNER